MNQYHVAIKPMGAVRMTQRGKFVKGPAQKYLAYKDEIKLQVMQQLKGTPLLTDQVEVNITFYMPIPQSWSKKKQEASVLKPHKSKPDIDNLIKGLFDALNGLVWKDDNLVAKVTATKLYGPSAEGIMFQVREIVEGDE